jgi:hypothetical protein
MSSFNPKTAGKKNPNKVKNRFNSGRNKEGSRFNPDKKPRFTGECEDHNECIFDCKGDR